MKKEQTCKDNCPLFDPNPNTYPESPSYGRCLLTMTMTYGDFSLCHNRKMFVRLRDAIRERDAKIKSLEYEIYTLTHNPDPWDA